IPNGISLHLFRDNLYIIPNAKALFFSILRQKLRHLWQYQSQYQLDTIPQTERTVPLVCFGL
ncbi:MAG: hypothetical protein MR656_09485, partial [Bacteroidales bacterium]|nr:hypothetical protein [Bacteroidales bacterium]